MTMRETFGIAWTLLAATAPAAAGQVDVAPDVQPITLLATQDGGGMKFQVAADARNAVKASYRLEVTSTPPSRNHVVQQGAATLAAGEHRVLLTTALGGDAGRSWVATLTVEPADGARYVVTRHSGG